MLALYVAVAFLFGVASCDLSVVKTKECDQLTCDYLYYCSAIDYTCKPCRRVCEPGGNYDLKICNSFCQDYIHDMRYLRRDEVVDNTKGISNKVAVTKEMMNHTKPNANTNGFFHYGMTLKNIEQLDKFRVLSTISLIFSLIVFICLVLVVAMLWSSKKNMLNVFNMKAQAMNKKKKSVIKCCADDRGQRNSNEISTIRVQNDTVLSMQDITDVIHSKTNPPQDSYLNMTTFKNLHAKSEPDSASSICTNKTSKTTQPLAKRLPSEDSTLDFIYDNPALAPSPVLDKDKEISSNESKKISDSDT